MRSLGGLGIGLSLVCGCLLLAVVAELYYLLWWKKRIVNSEGEEAKDFLSLLFWRRPSCVHSSCREGHGPDEGDVEVGAGKDVVVKAFGEEGIESELMRVHNLAGPPRFLFTIKEETKEDLERESVKSRSRSLSDLAVLGSFTNHGFNPLFETEPTWVKSSPPPMFKFLRDAEEKLLRRLKEDKMVSNIDVSSHQHLQGEEQKCPSSSSQVLPLPSSPTTLMPLHQKPIVH